jgi:hypothetical protein
LLSGKILTGDVPEGLAFFAEVCYLLWPVLNSNAGPCDGNSSEQILDRLSAKILLFLRRFVILPCRASAHITEEKGGYNDFVCHFFMTKSEEWR